jgi:hypothetical protein
MIRISFLLLAFFTALLTAQSQDLLPKLPAWNGKSEALMRSPDAPDALPFEKSLGLQSAGFDSCVAWFEAAALRSNYIHLDTLCYTASGNFMPMYYFSSEWPMNAQKPMLLIQAGIHSGEIDGLDAGMLLFRDLLSGKLKALQDKVNLAFIPVLNRDGLLRSSETNRINQRGPTVQGWRSNSLNQNLNRDFAKIDAPETRALVQLINKLNPTLYIDIHVTDGADYQYDITYGFIGNHGYSPGISSWMKTNLRPFVDTQLQLADHIPGDLVFLKDEARPEEGNMQYMFGPRFSHAYADARHTPGILVENHSLKPFKQRVLGTRVLLEAFLELLANKGRDLQTVMQNDCLQPSDSCALTWQDPVVCDTIDFLAFRSLTQWSSAAGTDVVTWKAEPYSTKIPLLCSLNPKLIRKKPKWFVIPVNRTDVIERLRAHGIQFRVLETDTTVNAWFFKLNDVAMAGKLPTQGRMRMQAKTELIKARKNFAKGSIFIDMRQPLSDLCMLLLDPDSPDSFFQWGMFADVTERTEYFEAYAMAPIAEQMMAENAQLKSEFEARCKSDGKFRKDAEARLRWWYERSKYNDENYLVYPIAFEP